MNKKKLTNLNSLMANSASGGGGGSSPTPNKANWFFFSMVRAIIIIPNKFCICRHILGASVNDKFSDWTYRVCSKIREREGAWDPPSSIPPWALSND